ncbi:MAG: hypothetical protein F9K40_06600 [Kofleriaceae bacterium]|nr:MAG: hypothetical protein F9K40_06600 [Kofleriaceae bacterium]
MKKQSLAFILGLAGLAGTALGACGGDDNMGDDDGTDVDAAVNPDATGPQTIRVNDDITADTTWEAENTYVLPRLKYVFVKDGATLTIEPGTKILGEQGSVLVITRGAKIEAAGTADNPIVMTSAQPDGMKTPGFWGGLLVLGAAPINVNVNSTPPSTEATFEAFTSAVPEGKFGGTNAADDSGTLKYVRVEFGGFNFVADREFNNITFAGVGSGTEVDFLQSHKGKDDGVEIFGGTVNMKHVVISQSQDDGLDSDNGWQGKVQFLVIQHVGPDGAADASNGYESDNHGTAASYTAAPRTKPTIYNATLVGKADYAVGSGSFATVIRRGTSGEYYNHLILNFPKGIEVRDTATGDQITAGNLFFKNSIFFNNDALGDMDNWPAPQASNDIDEEAAFMVTANMNREADPGMPAAAFNLANPTFKPNDGSAALTGGATPPSDGFFDTSATFVGAVGATDWTTGWTAYPQN